MSTPAAARESALRPRIFLSEPPDRIDRRINCAYTKGGKCCPGEARAGSGQAGLRPGRPGLRGGRSTLCLICCLVSFGACLVGTLCGIGGGLFNVAVLCHFFSMPTRRATQNSLLIVLLIMGISAYNMCKFWG